MFRIVPWFTAPEAGHRRLEKDGKTTEDALTEAKEEYPRWRAYSEEMHRETVEISGVEYTELQPEAF